MRRMVAVVVLALLMGPITGSLFMKSEPAGWHAVDAEGLQWAPDGFGFDVPEQAASAWLEDETPWWDRTALDQNRNGVHDSLESFIGTTGIGLSYGTEVSSHHLAQLESMNLSVVDVIESVDAVLLDSEQPYRLLEAMVDAILDRLMATPGVAKATVRIAKPEAPLPHPGGCPWVEASRVS